MPLCGMDSVACASRIVKQRIAYIRATMSTINLKRQLQNAVQSTTYGNRDVRSFDHDLAWATLQADPCPSERCSFYFSRTVCNIQYVVLEEKKKEAGPGEKNHTGQAMMNNREQLGTPGTEPNSASGVFRNIFGHILPGTCLCPSDVRLYRVSFLFLVTDTTASYPFTVVSFSL